MKTDDGVLTGLKVIDCATYVAGPAAATIMSDFGADVIKIERPPDGDLWRTFSSVPGYPSTDFHYTWLLTSRNKRSIVLDLTKRPGAKRSSSWSPAPTFSSPTSNFRCSQNSN